MRLYLELTKLAFRRQMSYRAAALAGLATNFFFGLLRAAVLIALYDTRQEVAGVSLPQAITFTALSQAVIVYLSLFSWYDLMHSVYTGEVATDLLKPVAYFRYWLARDLGRAAAALLTRGLTILLAYELVVDLVYPQSAVQWGFVILAVILGWLVSFSWRFLINLASFWTPNATGFLRFSFLTSLFLSGFMMPLRFFPAWVTKLAYLTPFPHTVTTLVEVYLGLLSSSEMVIAILYQLLWAAVLIGLGQFVLRAGVRRLVILGG